MLAESEADKVHTVHHFGVVTCCHHNIPNASRGTSTCQPFDTAAGRLIAAERPDLEAERGKVARDLDRAGEQLERYFLAFEDASMDPKACAPRVEALRRQIDALRGRQERIGTQLEQLNLPPLDLDEVAGLLEDFQHRFESDSRRGMSTRRAVRGYRNATRRIEMQMDMPHGMPIRRACLWMSYRR
jgi:hypothetical protein